MYCNRIRTSTLHTYSTVYLTLCYLIFAHLKSNTKLNYPPQYVYSIRWSSAPWRDKVSLGFETKEVAEEWRAKTDQAVRMSGMKYYRAKKSAIRSRSATTKRSMVESPTSSAYPDVDTFLHTISQRPVRGGWCFFWGGVWCVAVGVLNNILCCVKHRCFIRDFRTS